MPQHENLYEQGQREMRERIAGYLRSTINFNPEKADAINGLADAVEKVSVIPSPSADLMRALSILAPDA